MAVINGTAGSETLVGTSGSDTINGFEGNDRLIGAGGEDEIHGGQGNDRIFGGFSGMGDDFDADLLYGDEGSDTFEVYNLDQAYGGADDDSFNVYGVDLDVDGGTGFDTVWLDYRFVSGLTRLDFTDLFADGSVTIGGGHSQQYRAYRTSLRSARRDRHRHRRHELRDHNSSEQRSQDLCRRRWRD